ncbi:MAG: hypothetical protein M1823_005312 [Watsoniomyces obsoletus]|nr:MAG: hypothetical protein M1823_005312 [Watsoniomyces obsoletus]
MSSYLSNILTTTTSRYNSLRRTLLSDETDGDTEDDTHISRVLRAYYIEKGRPFPPWLPPDPRAPQRQPTQFTSTAGQPQQPMTGRGRGNLSDLWDTPQHGGDSQQEPLSLRRGRHPIVGGAIMTGRHGSEGGIDNGGNNARPFQPYTAPRAGSYQSSLPGTTRSDHTYSPSPPPTASSGFSAQERLKARLLGGTRSTSPSQPSSPPIGGTPSMEPQNPYDRRGNARYGSSSSQGNQGSTESGYGNVSYGRAPAPAGGGRHNDWSGAGGGRAGMYGSSSSSGGGYSGR